MTHRKITPKGRELIKTFEALSLKKYYCPAGLTTIGYGHVLTSNENYEEITLEIAEKMLDQDIFFAEKSVLKNIEVHLTDNQFDALVSFTFNLGGAALQRSALRHKINRGEYRDGANEFHRWVYAGGKKLAGLVKRRALEAEIFLM